MSIVLKTPSNGSVTLAEQDTASDVTVTIPAVTSTLLNNSSGIMNIGSGQIYKTSGGNTGLGTSSPDARLTLQSGGDVQLSFKDSGGTTRAYVGTAGAFGSAPTGALRLRSDQGGIVFGNSGSENMRLDTSGNLLINRTANPDGSALSVYGATPGVFENSQSGSAFTVIFKNPNGNVGSVQTNGSTTSYVTSSDYRLKENVQPMIGALAKVAQLNPITYKWKTDGRAGQGFIAHELQEIVPDCVTGKKDAVDDEGNPQYQGVDTSFLVATLVGAIQELNAKVTALEAQTQGASE